MVQLIGKLLWKTYEKKVYLYLFILTLLISFSFVQFNWLIPEKTNFWIWHLYLTSDLYTAIVGLPLLCFIGHYCISTVFFSNSLVILRFKDREKLFWKRLKLQFLFLIVFMIFIILLGSAISILATNIDASWSQTNIMQYEIIFYLSPYLELPVVSSVILTSLNLFLYLCFLLNSYQLFRLVVKEKIALFLTIGFIFSQAAIYKMNVHSKVSFLFPIYYYQAIYVENIVTNLVYWWASNMLVISLNYWLSMKRAYVE